MLQTLAYIIYMFVTLRGCRLSVVLAAWQAYCAYHLLEALAAIEMDEHLPLCVGGDNGGRLRALWPRLGLKASEVQVTALAVHLAQTAR
jgi:hypothetical protein